MNRFGTFKRVYRALALIFLNTCVLLLVANLALFVLFKIVDGRRDQSDRSPRSPETLSRHGVVHPGLDRRQIRELWEETYLASSGFVYEPYTQFKVRAFAGRYVSVDEHGFRRHPEVGPWPPEQGAFNVLLFGGSTTFGYGVPDDQTIAAHLQQLLAERPASGAPGRPARVYNFGRSGYFSTQERLLFERQLTDGVVPDVAVFIDGLNECRILDGVPLFSARLGKLFEVRNAVASTGLGRLPMMRLARAVVGRGRRRAAAARAPDSAPALAQTSTAGPSARMARQYLANKRMIEAVAASYGVEALFVWQPVSFYGYDRGHHLFADTDEPLVEAGYGHMAELAVAGRLGENSLWLADMQVGVEEPLYVDQAHYSGPMSRRIAGRIADWLVARRAAGG